MAHQNGRPRATANAPPPRDVPAERNLIGSVLASPEAMAGVGEVVADRDFFDPELRTIYSAVAKRHASGNPIDPSLVAADVANAIEDAHSKLSDIAATAPDARNAVQYARIVSDFSVMRQLLTITDGVRSGVHDRQDIGELVENLAYDVSELRRGHRGGPRADVVSLAGVEPMRTEWIWRQWIPAGTMSLLDGDPGLGKSTITIDLAARISNGWALPPVLSSAPVYRPANVVMMSAEDDLQRTIRQRVGAADADLHRLHVITSMDNNDRLPELPKDIPAIQRVVEKLDASLLVIDPLAAFIGQGVDTHRDSDVRRCLHRLARMAEESGVAVLLVRHLTKEAGKIAKYRGGGSIGIIGAARSAMIVAEHPKDDCCVLASTKSNLGPTPGSLQYRIRSARDTSNIEWLGSTPLSANDLVLAKPAKQSPKVDQCVELLLDMLADKPIGAKEATARCTKAGFSDSTIKRARKKAKVAISKVDFDGGWQWSLEGGQ